MVAQKSLPNGQALLLAGLLLFFCLPGLAQSHMTVRHDVHHDVSAPLREMILHARPPSLERREAEPARRIPLPPGLTQLEEDPVLQRTVVPFTPVVGTSFEGLGQGQYGFTVPAIPPDTEGTVGATQYVQWVNLSFAIFDKTSGALVSGPTAGNTLWSGFGGGCQTNNDGDPIVIYDKAAQRWVFSQFSVSTTPFLQCIAVSTTSDATGTYHRYSFQYNNVDDYPKMGVWADGYYETFNMFTPPPGLVFVGADACAYDRTAMLAGSAATQVCFQQGPSVGGLLPSDIDGATAPPAGSPNFMIHFGTNSLHLFKFHVDFTTPANSTFTGPTVIPVAAFSPLCGGGTCVPQPGTTQQLDSLADRLMYRLAYRNFGTHESLVTNHSVVAGSGGGVRWYEIQNPNGTPTVAQQGTFAPDSNFRWMGSIAMDQAGDMAVGYSVSSSSLHPSIRYTGRVPADPSGTMEAEVNVITGTGSQTVGRGGDRWGDYSAMQVDPVDDCTFWYTQEYRKISGIFSWNTRIANFRFPGCGGGTADFTVRASPSSVTITQGGSGTSTVTVTSLGGFNSATTLSATGLPSGVTADFAPNPVTPPANGNVTSTLTLTASGTATIGTSRVTITGTSGSLTHTATIILRVGAEFTVPANLTDPAPANPGQFTTTTMLISPVGGTFANNVTYKCSAGLPASATCSFNPAQLDATTSGGTVTITVQTAGPFTGGASRPQHRSRGQNPWLWLPLSLPLASMVLIGLAGRTLPRRYKIVGLCLALALTGFLVACGGGSSSTPPPPPPPPPPISVTVSPTPVNTLFPNLNANGTQAPAQAQQFSAKVNNSTNQVVTWAVSGGSGTPGSIDQTGLYSAPATLPNPNAPVTVTATSAADTTKSGQATVNIKTPTPPVTNQQITVTVTEGVTVHTTTFNLTVN